MLHSVAGSELIRWSKFQCVTSLRGPLILFSVVNVSQSSKTLKLTSELVIDQKYPHIIEEKQQQKNTKLYVLYIFVPALGQHNIFNLIYQIKHLMKYMAFPSASAVASKLHWVYMKMDNTGTSQKVTPKYLDSPPGGGLQYRSLTPPPPPHPWYQTGYPEHGLFLHNVIVTTSRKLLHNARKERCNIHRWLCPK